MREATFLSRAFAPQDGVKAEKLCQRRTYLRQILLLLFDVSQAEVLRGTDAVLFADEDDRRGGRCADDSGRMGGDDVLVLAKALQNGKQPTDSAWVEMGLWLVDSDYSRTI